MSGWFDSLAGFSKNLRQVLSRVQFVVLETLRCLSYLPYSGLIAYDSSKSSYDLFSDHSHPSKPEKHFSNLPTKKKKTRAFGSYIKIILSCQKKVSKESLRGGRRSQLNQQKRKKKLCKNFMKEKKIIHKIIYFLPAYLGVFFLLLLIKITIAIIIMAIIIIKCLPTFYYQLLFTLSFIQ